MRTRMRTGMRTPRKNRGSTQSQGWGGPLIHKNPRIPKYQTCLCGTLSSRRWKLKTRRLAADGHP